MKNRVVITGMGAITPIGNNVKTFWKNIKKGKCGIDFIKAFDTSEFKVKIAAEIKNFNPTDVLDSKELKRMDKFTQIGLVAANEAVEDAGLSNESDSRENWGVILGTGIGGFITIEKENRKIIEKGPGRVSPFFIPMALCNIAAANIAIKFGIKGICDTVITACASGTSSIGNAYRILQQNQADLIVAGGSEAAMTPLALAGFTSMGALCTHNKAEQASIPFDIRRTGFVMGEGAGIMILETLKHAQKRGANIYAEVVGYGTTCDAYHITTPAPGGNGGARAMKMAINDSGINEEQISYINAHGTSTPYNDKSETEAIKTVFGEKAYGIPISSTKSMTGHMLGASGAAEAIVCIKAMQESFIPPTIGLLEQDPECDLDYVPLQGRNQSLQYTISNSFGFGGQNASILLKKWEE
ncbi:beta-ketoacyl-[acyl-carrier-protein] synthase II [Candidatus Atribacteria bacterium RBG_19FT_COMBO_35_14]|uniref:3-oxoacyl-[acyl-carrier-protein] synthase 2 n=1 Tax=Candidatus Sediminicultor quintus TaxID=1797291 RepID=A0A1F5A663_9BACT|nr:MAG: beta-ketoacyl-[acyl-carrier-protein] synthase II [Candidatus Atribacteria bacterium RBG_19FT_COMBO_35_14]